jgi:hypothetical protein
LAELDVATIQQREGRWVLADLEGKGRRIRTVAIPIWVKHGINAWMTAAGIEDDRLLRSLSKSGKVNRDTLSVWSVVEQSSKEMDGFVYSASDDDDCEGAWNRSRTKLQLFRYGCGVLPVLRGDEIHLGVLMICDHCFGTRLIFYLLTS